jgi:hypothetical protein
MLSISVVLSEINQTLKKIYLQDDFKGAQA